MLWITVGVAVLAEERPAYCHLIKNWIEKKELIILKIDKKKSLGHW